MKITETRGMRISKKVLVLLRKHPAMKKLKKELDLGVLNNGRETGLTYAVATEDWSESFTWTTYEHRNSDQIILNGCPGWKPDLPYKSDSKWGYIAAFGPEEYQECADRLAKEIVKFFKTFG